MPLIVQMVGGVTSCTVTVVAVAALTFVQSVARTNMFCKPVALQSNDTEDPKPAEALVLEI